MAIGAFFTLAFISPDLFDQIRDDVSEVATDVYSTVQEKVVEDKSSLL